MLSAAGNSHSSERGLNGVGDILITRVQQWIPQDMLISGLLSNTSKCPHTAASSVLLLQHEHTLLCYSPVLVLPGTVAFCSGCMMFSISSQKQLPSAAD